MFMDLHKSWTGFFRRSHSCYDIYNLERWMDLAGMESNPAARLSSGFILELLGILALVAKWVIF